MPTLLSSGCGWSTTTTPTHRGAICGSCASHPEGAARRSRSGPSRPTATRCRATPTEPSRPRPSGDLEHALERPAGPHGGVVVDSDAVHDLSVHETLEHPPQMGGIDAKHGRPGPHQRVEGPHGLVGVLV